MGENSSEIARIRQQIELEYVAAVQGLCGYAAVARHDFIEARMDSMGVCHSQLIALLGEQEAGRVMVETIEQASSG